VTHDGQAAGDEGGDEDGDQHPGHGPAVQMFVIADRRLAGEVITRRCAVLGRFSGVENHGQRVPGPGPIMPQVDAGHTRN